MTKEIEDIIGHSGFGRPASALVTLVSVDGSSYRRPGARMLVFEGASVAGSISGGCLEEDIVARAVRVAASGRPESAVYDTSEENDLVWGVGLGCQGTVRVVIEPLAGLSGWATTLGANLAAGRPTPVTVTWSEAAGTLGTRLGAHSSAYGVFFEEIEPGPSLTIFGAGEDARPLERLASGLGWRVTVADPRPAWVSVERFPGAVRFVSGPADELVGLAAPAEGSLAVVMTHRYLFDRPILAELLPRPLAYLGLLGPRARSERILAEMEAEGREVTAAMRARLHAPVGLDLGSDGPDEVALSIIAEMRAILSGRDARPLKERALPIHA